MPLHSAIFGPVRLLTALAVTAALAAASLATAPPAAADDDDLMTWTSPLTVSQTRERLVQAIGDAGATIFATVDHADGAEAVGMELEPNVLVIFGNPKLGTPIIKANPLAGLDLPIRILIYSRNGQTHLATLSPDELEDRYDIEGLDKSFTTMTDVLNNLVGQAVSQ